MITIWISFLGMYLVTISKHINLNKILIFRNLSAPYLHFKNFELHLELRLFLVCKESRREIVHASKAAHDW